MAVNISVWPGSSSFFPGDTVFGYYDYDFDFQTDADATAKWCAQRLGYPIQEVELQPNHFYMAFEEAVTEFGNQVNMYSARDSFMNVLGSSTSLNLTNRVVSANFNGVLHLSKEYGSLVDTGGSLTLYTGSINVQSGRAVYDITDTSRVYFESGSVANDAITVKRFFHDNPPAVARYFDPYLGSGTNTQLMLNSFGWGNYSPGVSFMMLPMYADVLRFQSIELNDMIRKSSYGFEFSKNRLRIWPVPTMDFTIFFHYHLNSERDNPLRTPSGSISDLSNIPYSNMSYENINDIGRQWIRKYALALSKEMLGQVRGKYSSVPIPNSEITLNGADLLGQAQTEKDALLTELKEMLDSFSRQSQLERKDAESTSLQSQMIKIPLKIYTA
jgi:hypothetical protein